MTAKDFTLAIEIISESHSTEIIINKVEPNGQVSPVLASPTIHIKSCCASVVNRLLAHQYSVSMKNGLMSVDKY